MASMSAIPAHRKDKLANKNSVCFVAISVDILVELIGKRNLIRERKGQKANKISAAIMRSLGSSYGSMIFFSSFWFCQLTFLLLKKKKENFQPFTQGLLLKITPLHNFTQATDLGLYFLVCFIFAFFSQQLWLLKKSSVVHLKKRWPKRQRYTKYCS